MKKLEAAYKKFLARSMVKSKPSSEVCQIALDYFEKFSLFLLVISLLFTVCRMFRNQPTMYQFEVLELS